MLNYHHKLKKLNDQAKLDLAELSKHEQELINQRDQSRSIGYDKDALERAIVYIRIQKNSIFSKLQSDIRYLQKRNKTCVVLDISACVLILLINISIFYKVLYGLHNHLLNRPYHTDHFANGFNLLLNMIVAVVTFILSTTAITDIYNLTKRLIDLSDESDRYQIN